MPPSLHHSAFPVLPLSEDEPLFLPEARELVLGAAGKDDAPAGQWDEVTALSPGEKRTIHLIIRLKSGVQARMIRVFDVPAGSSLAVSQLIEAEAGADWNGTFVIRGRGEIRIRRALHVFGPDVRAELHCLSTLASQARMSAADEIFCNQPSADVAIRTLFVLKDEAQGIARARIAMGQQAQGSRADEELHGLALSDHAEMRSIPELEVETNDVQSRHAASRLPPDEAALFYLQSRGLALAEAQAVLSRGFARPILHRLPEALREESENLLFR